MVKNKVWINKALSFDEAEQFEIDYYMGLSGEERIEIVQILRENYFKSKGLYTGENGKRLRRVFRIVKQA